MLHHHSSMALTLCRDAVPNPRISQDQSQAIIPILSPAALSQQEVVVSNISGKQCPRKQTHLVSKSSKNAPELRTRSAGQTY